MKLTFLGTSAGESYPALWCHCPNCEYARTHGGRNIRQNSCAFLDDDVMIDLSSHAFHTALRLGVDITQMRYLFVTHDHRDHFDSQHLTWRALPYAEGKMQKITVPFEREVSIHQMGARHTLLPNLEMYGHESIMEALKKNPRFRSEGMEENYNLSFHALSGGETFECNGLKVTALVSHHGNPGSVLNYIFSRNGSTLLYALDCGGYDKAMLDILCQHRFDCVVMEGTFGHMPEEYSMHQNKEKNLRMLKFFQDHHLWVEKPRLILSHMSPHWTPPYDLYVLEMASLGGEVAYDGLTIQV